MPSVTFIKPLGHGVFISKMMKMPVKSDWKDPKGDPDKDQYPEGVGFTKWGIPPSFMPFFTPQNPHKYHSEACDATGKDFKKFHDDALDAIKFAVDMFRLQAKFKDLKVNAVTALGTPGCLDGPELESLIKTAPSVAAYMGNWAKYRDAVAKGISECFKKWQGKVMVPGLPWYPAFAVFPGPQAPPMPNVPMPLIACVSAKVTEITTPSPMKKAMIKALDSSLKKEDSDKKHETLFESIATVAAVGFLLWLVSQQVNLVMGKGPIPTFAPPYVPVGPVVMGDNIAVPGHLMA